jgi:hypothetical protein
MTLDALHICTQQGMRIIPALASEHRHVARDVVRLRTHHLPAGRAEIVEPRQVRSARDTQGARLPLGNGQQLGRGMAPPIPGSKQDRPAKLLT